MGTSAFLLTSLAEGTYTLDLSRLRLRPTYISGNPVLAPVAAEGRHTIAHVARRGFTSPSPTKPRQGRYMSFPPTQFRNQKNVYKPQASRPCLLSYSD